MTEYVTLLGTEEVGRAANSISQSATTMRSAAETYAFALQQHQQFMEDWLFRFTEALKQQEPVATPSEGA